MDPLFPAMLDWCPAATFPRYIGQFEDHTLITTDGSEGRVQSRTVPRFVSFESPLILFIVMTYVDILNVVIL